MPLILGTNSIKDTGYDVANSCRFNDASDDSLTKTFSSAVSTRQQATVSMWVKLGNIDHTRFLFECSDGANPTQLYISSGNKLAFYDTATNSSFTTDAVLRDASAWYHLVCRVDTTQSSNSDRVKLYINGSLQSTTTSNTLTQNNNILWGKNSTHTVGKRFGSSDSFDGYIAEFVFIMSSSLDATSFGEFDSDSPTIWKPIDVSGLTFNSNSFYLDFKDSSALGNDVSGLNNDFTANNLSAIDQSTDTCTNNFATMNSLDNNYASSTFTEGNLKVVTTGGNITYNTSTIGFSSGKWYMETKLAGSSGYTVGVVRGVATANDNGNKLGNRADGWSYDDGGDVEHNGGTLTGSFASYSSGNIIGIYADLDNNKLYFSKDGVLQNSGTGLTLTAGTYFFAVGDNNASNSSTYEVNFGSPSFAISSGNTDGEYGNFEYSTTITGDGASKTFKALNTKNLAEYG